MTVEDIEQMAMSCARPLHRSRCGPGGRRALRRKNAALVVRTTRAVDQARTARSSDSVNLEALGYGPEGWDELELSDLIDVKHGFAFKGDYFRDSPPGDVLLTPGNFAIGGGFKVDKPKYYAGPVMDEYVLAAGDLIVTMTDLSKSMDTLGYPAIVPVHPPNQVSTQPRLGLITIKRPIK